MNRLPEVAIGTVSFLIAMLCLVFIVTYTGPQFDSVIINDHVEGGNRLNRPSQSMSRREVHAARTRPPILMSSGSTVCASSGRASEPVAY